MPKGVATITVVAPAMRVEMLGLRLQRTYLEHMTATIKFSDGSMLVVPNVDIPPTLVHPSFWPWYWAVDACIGQDKNKIVTINLPKESVSVYLLKGYSIAEPMDCPSMIKLPTGEVGYGSIHFGESKVPFSTGIASEVIATGTIEFK